jgi:hypothetical protein
MNSVLRVLTLTAAILAGANCKVRAGAIPGPTDYVDSVRANCTDVYTGPCAEGETRANTGRFL